MLLNSLSSKSNSLFSFIRGGNPEVPLPPTLPKASKGTGGGILLAEADKLDAATAVEEAPPPPRLFPYFARFFSFSISSFSCAISLSLVCNLIMASPSSHISTTLLPYRTVLTRPSFILCSLRKMRRSFLFLSSSSVKYFINVSM